MRNTHSIYFKSDITAGNIYAQLKQNFNTSRSVEITADENNIWIAEKRGKTPLGDVLISYNQLPDFNSLGQTFFQEVPTEMNNFNALLKFEGLEDESEDLFTHSPYSYDTMDPATLRSISHKLGAHPITEILVESTGDLSSSSLALKTIKAICGNRREPSVVIDDAESTESNPAIYSGTEWLQKHFPSKRYFNRPKNK